MKLFYFFTSLIIFSILFISCSSNQAGNVVDVTARDYYFVVSDSIPSGWITFRLKNEGECHHFFFLTLLPDSIPFERYGKDVGSAFVIARDSLQAGMDKAKAGALLGSLLPKWYGSAKYMGGTGLIAPGKTALTTMKLVPGTYVMECYMKTKEGKFHGELGMVRPITVTEKVSEMKEPNDADLDLTLSNNNIEPNGELSSGIHRVAVHFKEQPQIGLGNDIHLVQLNKNTDMDQLIAWMDWMNINGLRAPAPVEFLGGTQEMPAGYTSYFTVDLEPGRYAWISETAKDKNLVKEFTIE
jgi:hypothetical protein